MRGLTRCLRSEVLKLRRTLALWSAVLAPLVVVTLQTLILVARRDRFFPPGTNPWELLAHSFGLWALLMLPLLVTLVAALVFGLEHQSQAWKHLDALPVPRASVYLSKTLVVAGLIGLSTAVLLLGIVAIGGLLTLVQPGLVGPVPTGELLRVSLLVFLSSLLVVAIHSFLGMRLPTFTSAMGAGIAATVIGFIAANSERWVKVYPWTLPLNVLRRPWDEGLVFAFASLVLATALTWAAGRHTESLERS